MGNLALQDAHFHVHLVERHDVDNRITSADPFPHLGSSRGDVTVEAGDDRVFLDAILELFDDGVLDSQSCASLQQFLRTWPRDSQLVAGLGVVKIPLGADGCRDDRSEVVLGHRPLSSQGGEASPPADMEFATRFGCEHSSLQLDDFSGSRSVLQFLVRFLAEHQFPLGRFQLQFDCRRQQSCQWLTTTNPVPFLNWELGHPTVNGAAYRCPLEWFDRTDKRMPRGHFPLHNRNDNHDRRPPLGRQTAGQQ